MVILHNDKLIKCKKAVIQKVWWLLVYRAEYRNGILYYITLIHAKKYKNITPMSDYTGRYKHFYLKSTVHNEILKDEFAIQLKIYFCCTRYLTHAALSERCIQAGGPNFSRVSTLISKYAAHTRERASKQADKPYQSSDIQNHDKSIRQYD